MPAVIWCNRKTTNHIIFFREEQHADDYISLFNNHNPQKLPFCYNNLYLIFAVFVTPFFFNHFIYVFFCFFGTLITGLIYIPLNA